MTQMGLGVSMIKDITGAKFGRLIAISYSYTAKWREQYWLFKCDCGKEKIIRKKDVVQGKSKSCGCFHKEIVTTHGMNGTNFYKVWGNIKARCLNTNDDFYNYYGGRGIKVCDKWLRFEGFYEDMFSSYKQGLSIDRIDGNGNYCKENCKWATSSEQQRNRRDNVYLKMFDKCISVYDLVKKTGVHKDTLIYRYKNGWRNNKLIQPVIMGGGNA